MTQPDQTIDHASPANGFPLGIISGNAPARLVSASTATESLAIVASSGYQPPANKAGLLMFKGFEDDGCGLAKHYCPESAPFADLGAGLEAGGEGVEASARSQSLQCIPPRRKFSHCQP